VDEQQQNLYYIRARMLTFDESDDCLLSAGCWMMSLSNSGTTVSNDLVGNEASSEGVVELLVGP
jgi:hypothetical protein